MMQISPPGDNCRLGLYCCPDCKLKGKRGIAHEQLPVKAKQGGLEDAPPAKYRLLQYIKGRYDLYLTTEFAEGAVGHPKRYYRLHACSPHTIEMALAYDVKCPRCGAATMKQVGRCRDYHTLGLYECPVCDRK